MEPRDGSSDEKPLHLPPRELWQFTPETDERLPTPIDDNGLVDIEQLIAVVKSTVDPSFTWKPTAEPNRHHLYWYRSKYPSLPENDINPREFRNLATNKVTIPSMFHNWLHLVTECPPIPNDEVMYYRIEAQRAITKLFAEARRGVRSARRKKFNKTLAEERLALHFENFSLHLEEARTIPKELQLIDLSDYNPKTPDDMHTISHLLGELAARNTTRVRDVFKLAAA